MTKEAYNDFRREFENKLVEYKSVVEDAVVFRRAVDYNSQTLLDAEHALRKNLIEMYVGLLDIVRTCEVKGWKND